MLPVNRTGARIRNRQFVNGVARYCGVQEGVVDAIESSLSGQPDQLAALARAITGEVLRQLASAEPQALPECVLVFAERSAEAAATVHACFESIPTIFFYGEDSTDHTPVQHVIPLLSCRAMAEFATGTPSTPARNDVQHLLLSGTDVCVLDYEYRRYRETAPAALYALYEQYEETLAAYGMKEWRKPPQAARVFRGTLVTEETVTAMHADGVTSLRVPAGTIVTPLAAERAGAVSMRICKEE